MKPVPDNVKEVLSQLSGPQQVVIRQYIATLRTAINEAEEKLRGALDPEDHAHYHGEHRCTEDHGDHGHEDSHGHDKHKDAHDHGDDHKHKDAHDHGGNHGHDHGHDHGKSKDAAMEDGHSCCNHGHDDHGHGDGKAHSDHKHDHGHTEGSKDHDKSCGHDHGHKSKDVAMEDGQSGCCGGHDHGDHGHGGHKHDHGNTEGSKGHDHSHENAKESEAHKHENEATTEKNDTPAWKKKALEDGNNNPMAAPFGGSWNAESQVNARADKMEE